ncbi:MAG: alpha,alpha-trehalase TreA [Ferruginibacter sp.]|nr:alpha,alpha-trehalase TreA [Ferruginibacter sp.]
MKILLTASLAILSFSSMAQQKETLTPDKIYGVLFKDIQLQHIFPDGKTFVDCVPKRKVADIMYDYGMLKSAGFDLKKFVADNFELPVNPTSDYSSDAKQDLATHIKTLWSVLKRNPDKAIEGSSLLPLPYPYIVPGGRFREIYYWDSYFTMLGLKESNEWEMVENMINNFAYLINKYGHIPNGNRSYYLSRSQPPYFAMMVNLLADKKGPAVYATYQKELQKEYDYWMDKTAATKHVVVMPDGSILNRFYDIDDKPRQESYREDFDIATIESKGDTAAFAQKSRELRSGAESGWDFSSRWFADGKNIATIATTNIIPVDLNGLMYNLELTLAKAYKQTGNNTTFKLYIEAAAKRKIAINKYCYNAKQNWYFDYNISAKKQSTEQIIAGVSPLFFNIAAKKSAAGIAAVVKAKFLKVGGLVTTLKNSGQQWDAPNGWAPLQWIAVKGFENYGLKKEAKDIAGRWVALNEKVYANTGKMMEKYNVVNAAMGAGGGEYKSQDGFGWTNGVYLAMKSKLLIWKNVEVPKPAVQKNSLKPGKLL